RPSDRSALRGEKPRRARRSVSRGDGKRSKKESARRRRPRPRKRVPSATIGSWHPRGRAPRHEENQNRRRRARKRELGRRRHRFAENETRDKRGHYGFDELSAAHAIDVHVIHQVAEDHMSQERRKED